MKPQRKADIVIKIDEDDGELCIKTFDPEAHRLVVSIAGKFPELMFADFSANNPKLKVEDFFKDPEVFMSELIDAQRAVDPTEPVERGHLHLIVTPELYDPEEMKTYILDCWAKRKTYLDEHAKNITELFEEKTDD